jgi:hypothetical protein
MRGLRIELVDPTGQLLGEIADRRLCQKDVAQTLALVRLYRQEDEVDWAAVAAAAIERWSRPGWRRIKTLAHSERCWPLGDAV